MKIKKDLAKYLAGYLSTGIDRLHERGFPMDFTKQGLKPLIEEGLNIFELTKEVKIVVEVEK